VVTKDGNKNVAEIHNQALMMLGHVIFDPETNRNVLVDHAFIVAGGVITKQARNWLGSKLDAAKRSQIMFIDRIHSVSHAAQAAMADALEGVQFHGNNSSSFWAG
jgi:hypothetical protein